MNIRAKFDGGKQYNKNQQGSWEGRCAGADLRHNLGPEWELLFGRGQQEGGQPCVQSIHWEALKTGGKGQEAKGNKENEEKEKGDEERQVEWWHHASM